MHRESTVIALLEINFVPASFGGFFGGIENSAVKKKSVNATKSDEIEINFLPSPVP